MKESGDRDTCMHWTIPLKGLNLTIANLPSTHNTNQAWSSLWQDGHKLVFAYACSKLVSTDNTNQTCLYLIKLASTLTLIDTGLYQAWLFFRGSSLETKLANVCLEVGVGVRNVRQSNSGNLSLQTFFLARIWLELVSHRSTAHLDVQVSWHYIQVSRVKYTHTCTCNCVTTCNKCII